MRRVEEVQQGSKHTFAKAEKLLEAGFADPRDANTKPDPETGGRAAATVEVVEQAKTDIDARSSGRESAPGLQREPHRKVEMENHSSASMIAKDSEDLALTPRIQTPELVKALGTAAMQGFTDTVALLLETGVDVDAYDGECTALWRAAERGHSEAVELLLEHKADPNLPRKKGTSPLLAAASRNHVNVVRMLIREGADATIPGLMHKAMDCMDDDMLGVLVDAGADLHAIHDGKTVLIAAIYWEKLDVVAGLLQRGASPTAQAKDGTSPLVVAASRNRSDIVQLLLRYGQRRT